MNHCLAKCLAILFGKLQAVLTNVMGHIWNYFVRNIICSLYQVLKRIWNFSSNGPQVHFIKVSLVQLVVCLKGLACVYILFLSKLSSLKITNFLAAAVQNLKLSAFQACQNHSKSVDFWYAVYMQFICSLYAVYMQFSKLHINYMQFGQNCI